MSALIDRFDRVRAEIAAAESGAGRVPGSVALLTVSKTRPVEELLELYRHGVRCFGENREPELMQKVQALPKDIEWHFIGPLQANKVRKVVRIASVIHSVSSTSLIERVERISEEERRTPRFLVEVNVSGEESKGGITPAEAPAAVKLAASASHACFCGLMTMAPAGASHDELMRYFTDLRDLCDAASRQIGRPLPLLSMGMSGDFPEAIAAGATIVRVGSRIFRDEVA